MPRGRTYVAAVLMVLTVVATACGGGDGDIATADGGGGSGTAADLHPEALITASEGGSIGLPDGSVRLDIPPGALPEDTDISVAEVAESEYPEGLERIEQVRAVYRFEPDGLAFEEPAIATFQAPLPDDETARIPAMFVLTRSSNTWEQAFILGAKTDLSSGRQSMKVELEHFSYVTIFDGAIVLSLTPRQVVTTPGSTWTATAELVNEAWNPDLPLDSYAQGPLLDSEAATWSSSGVVEGSGETDLGGSGITNRPLETSFGFSCDDEGRGTY
ncbi:MAG: hypothetical protein R3324_18730, partial [Halobacteriales archaeon]|nr:hypothetical protein [Halobacteriales archaeon]